VGEQDLIEDDYGGGINGEFGGCYAADFLGFGALDAHEGGVAEFVAAGLDGEDGGGGQVDGLEPAFFELAFDGEAGFGFRGGSAWRGAG